MKVTCNFCKTEYNLSKKVVGPVKCAICGHTWFVRRQNQKNVLMVFIASLCALLAAMVFATVVILNHRANQASKQPLVVSVTDVHMTADEMGVPHFVVTGRVDNNSDDIYGVPNLVVLSHDADGRVVARQKVMSPATLLDAGASVSFTHTLTAPTDGVNNITIEFQK